MPSIIVYNDEKNVLYQNIVGHVQELVKAIHDDGTWPNFSEPIPPVRINEMIILTEQIHTSKRVSLKLTTKQCAVLQFLACSITPEQIAKKMGVTLPTIRMHINVLKKKFKADTRDQLMAMAGYLQICDPFIIESKEKR
jgi:DNA-binding NarL/FixJ family response regulator